MKLPDSLISGCFKADQGAEPVPVLSSTTPWPWQQDEHRAKPKRAAAVLATKGANRRRPVGGTGQRVRQK